MGGQAFVRLVSKVIPNMPAGTSEIVHNTFFKHSFANNTYCATSEKVRTRVVVVVVVMQVDRLPTRVGKFSAQR